MLGISVSKFHELFPVVENVDPHRLHARLEQIPSETHLQSSTRDILLWGRTDFLCKQFGETHFHSFNAFTFLPRNKQFMDRNRW